EVAADRSCDLAEQGRAVHGLRPRLGFRERDRVALPAVVVEAEPHTLIAHQTIENSSADTELLGRTFALLLVLKRRELREPLDLGVGVIRVRLALSLLLLALRFHIVRRFIDQRVEFFAAVACIEPVGNIATLRTFAPMPGEHETAHALGNAERCATGRVAMRTRRRIPDTRASPSQSVRRILSLPPTQWQVLGAGLN